MKVDEKGLFFLSRGANPTPRTYTKAFSAATSTKLRSPSPWTRTSGRT